MTYKCSYCETEYEKAQKCPACGAPASKAEKLRQAPPPQPMAAGVAPKKKSFSAKRVLLWVLAAVGILSLGIVVLIFVSLSASSRSYEPAPPYIDVDSIPYVPEGSRFELGQAGEVDGVSVTLHSVTESAGSARNRPAEGNIFLLLEFEVVNGADKELYISSYKFDAYVDEYSVNSSYNAVYELESSNMELHGEVKAGKRIRGYVGYEVPADWQRLEIHMSSPDYSSNDSLVIEVDRETFEQQTASVPHEAASAPQAESAPDSLPPKESEPDNSER